MRTVELDVAKFAADPDASLVVSLMMVLNDVERLSDLRNVHFAYPRKHQSGSFEFSIGGYTANLCLAHISEAFLILRKIRDQKARAIYTAIQAEPTLKKAFDEACKYIDDTKDATTGESPYDALLRKWKNLRNYVVFHYDGAEDKIPAALAQVAENYKTSFAYYGEKETEPLFYELAYEVLDAVASDALGYPFPNENQEIIDDIVAKAQSMIKDFRAFAHHVVSLYVDKFKITPAVVPASET